MAPGSPLPPPPTQEQKRAAISEAWRLGYLRWKLDPGQQLIYDRFHSVQSRKFYVNCARRRGKSFFLCAMALEFALKHPNCSVKYAAPTAKMVKKIIRGPMRKLLEDCPQELQPAWYAADGEYRFKNGSILTIAGCDNQNYELLLGTESHLNIIDECGYVDNLEVIVNDVLVPMTLETGGKTMLASTPPRSPGHVAVEFARECEAAGAYFHQTLYDNPRLSAAQVEAFIRESAGTLPVEEFMKTPTFRREYLAEFVVDTEAAVIPEWDDTTAAELVCEPQRPSHCDRYVSLDIGWRDGSGGLFAYWDFSQGCLTVEDETLLFKATTQDIARSIAEKEAALWGQVPPYRRVADNDLLVIADLQELGLTFVPTGKDDKELQVNQLRMMVRNRKLRIHPRCKQLIRQLHTTIWNKQRTSYERNKDGHGDLLDALVYMVRNIDRANNPFPAESRPNADNNFMFRHQDANGSGAAILSLFSRKRVY